jgi:uncharacterized protein GlcG (DUF336 family)
MGPLAVPDGSTTARSFRTVITPCRNLSHPPAYSRGEPEDAGGRRRQGGRALPVTVNGEVIGAIAAAGAKIEQDVLIAQAALAVIGGRQT